LPIILLAGCAGYQETIQAIQDRAWRTWLDLTTIISSIYNEYQYFQFKAIFKPADGLLPYFGITYYPNNKNKRTARFFAGIW
jgi:hypothetical protein